MEDKGLNAARRVRIPIGKSSTKQMIDAGFYADKTDYISNLFEDEGTYYFFIRPRRFGKSLLLDTIDQIAQRNIVKCTQLFVEPAARLLR